MKACLILAKYAKCLADPNSYQFITATECCKLLCSTFNRFICGEKAEHISTSSCEATRNSMQATTKRPFYVNFKFRENARFYKKRR